MAIPEELIGFWELVYKTANDRGKIRIIKSETPNIFMLFIEIDDESIDIEDELSMFDGIPVSDDLWLAFEESYAEKASVFVNVGLLNEIYSILGTPEEIKTEDDVFIILTLKPDYTVEGIEVQVMPRDLFDEMYDL